MLPLPSFPTVFPAKENPLQTTPSWQGRMKECIQERTIAAKSDHTYDSIIAKPKIIQRKAKITPVPPRVKGELIDNSSSITYSDAALTLLSKRGKNEPSAYGSHFVLERYNGKDYLLGRQVKEFEAWYKEGDIRQIEEYILEATGAVEYDGPDYSALTGENAIRANRVIQPAEIIGPYSGEFITGSEFSNLCRIGDLLDFSPGDYSFDVPGTKLVLNGSQGNQMHCINDGTLKDDYGVTHKNRYNAEFMVVYTEVDTARGKIKLPRVYVVSNQKIEKGEYVWLSYGRPFWKRRECAKASLQAQLKTSNNGDEVGFRCASVPDAPDLKKRFIYDPVGPKAPLQSVENLESAPLSPSPEKPSRKRKMDSDQCPEGRKTKSPYRQGLFSVFSGYFDASLNQVRHIGS